MNILYHLCIALSIGIILGFLAGGIKYIARKKPYTDQQIQRTHNFLIKIALFVKYFTFLLLITGFIWCCFFLIVGIVFPELSDYANNMAELIVSVLTVISILFAFIEFLKHNDK